MAVVDIRGNRFNHNTNYKGRPLQLWWSVPKDEVPEMVFGTARYLADKHTARLAGNLHHLRIYSNRVAQSLTGSSFTAAVDNGDRIKLNATKSAIDASTAQIATNQPSIMHLTVKAPWEERKRAERLDRYIKGWFHELQLHIAWLGVFLDACIDGVGAMKFIALPNGRMTCERVRSDEIFVDENINNVVMPAEGPDCIYQMRPVSRAKLLGDKRFKKYENEINEAEYIEDAHPHYPWIEDPVTVVECWRPPRGNEKGRHAMCLSNVGLLDEQWKFGFPFAWMRWNDSPLGFYGIGAVEEASPVQIELNWLAQKLQRLLHFATSVIFREKNSAIGKITNEDFAIYDYTGQPPQFLNVQAAGPELYQHIDRLYNRIYELLGVSMMEATGAKPPGLYSGEAIRLYHDVATRRFRHIEQRAAQFFLDCAEQVKDRAREIVWRGWGSATTLAMGDKEVERLDWSDVAMEREMYSTRIRPTSIIPDEPAGKVDLIKSMAPIAPQMSQYLLGALSGNPDLEAMVARANAPQEYAERLVSNIIEQGQFEMPFPEADLAQIRDIAQRERLRAEENGVPPARQAMLSRLVVAVDTMQMQQAAAAMPGGAPAGGAGAGMAPPGMPGLPPEAIGSAMGGGQAPTMLPPGASLPGLGGALPQ